MADRLRLIAAANVEPAVGDPSGEAFAAIKLDETITLKRKTIGYYELTSDGAVAISLGSLASVHFVMFKTTGKVKARFTSADGSTQIIPIDSFLILNSMAVPFTAIDVERVAGTLTYVHAFLGEKG